MNARKNERGEHGSQAKRTEDSTRPRQRNIRTQKEGSLSASEQWWLRCTVYTEAWRSGDLDSGVICEARCVVPLSRSVLHAFAEEGCANRASAERGQGGDRREEEEQREGGGERREAVEGSVFLVDPPRRPLEENSGLRRRGLFVPRRDAFGASYLRVTPCNRAPASVFSFLLSVPLVSTP